MFPQYPKPQLKHDDVVAYLLQYRQKGWDIFQGPSKDIFVIRLTDNINVFIEYVNDSWRVMDGQSLSHREALYGMPENIAALDAAITEAVSLAPALYGLSFEWSSIPHTTRLKRNEPITNLSKIVAMISSMSIDAIFDSYLDNQGLRTILDLSSLGVKVTPSIRLLTSTKMIQSPSKSGSRLTDSFLRDWFNQMGCHQGELKHKDYKGHQRRFLLLSGGMSLLLGASLNNLNVDEASAIESDIQDKEFFESEWASAQSLNV